MINKFQEMMIVGSFFLQEEKLNNLGIDSQNARDFQRPYKFSSKLEEDDDVQEKNTGDSPTEETHKS